MVGATLENIRAGVSLSQGTSNRKYYACKHCHYVTTKSGGLCHICGELLIEVVPPPDGRCSWNSIKNQIYPIPITFLLEGKPIYVGTI